MRRLFGIGRVPGCSDSYAGVTRIRFDGSPRRAFIGTGGLSAP